MSRDSHDSTYGSWSRIKASLNIITATEEDVVELDNKQKTMLKKHRKRPSLLTTLDAGNEVHAAAEDSPSAVTPSSTFASSSGRLRSSLSLRQTIKRSSTGQIPSSLRGLTKIQAEKNDVHSNNNGSEPVSAVSTHSTSLSLADALNEIPTTSKTVIIHGEVQTSASMFRKKKEYLVLTDYALTRYKTQAKAAETYASIGHQAISNTRPIKHTPSQSYGSASDLQTVSDSSGDRAGRIPLTDVVAVCIFDDGKPYFSIEVSFLDEETGHASAVTLQFSNPQERETWITSLRTAVSEAHLREGHRIASYNVENAARLVERSNDYDPENCAIYKVMQRSSMTKTHARSSSDDISKVASTVGLLAIGVHKIHLIPLTKSVNRTSSPSLASSGSQFVSSYGILTVSIVRVSDSDDTFELTLRHPLQRAHTLHLASSAVYDIVTRLYHCENMLRPEAGHRFYRLSAPSELNDMLPPSVESSGEDDHNHFQRTLVAYCVAYGVDPTNLRYAIDYNCEDSPRFNLLRAADERHAYSALELLAVFRALRYNETFSSYSFSGVPLNSLKGLHDIYGREFVCTRTKMGTMIRLSPDELARADLLKQEVRALAVTNRKLRRIDFSGCISTKAKTTPKLLPDESQDAAVPDPGCGIVEALLPLCRHQTTNVDWICLNGIELTDSDLDYLIGAAVDKACHFRALELNRCALDDRSLGLLLDALRAQENTLEAIELAGNAVRIEPSTFDSQLSVFGFVRKLDLSFTSLTSGPEPILQAETFMIWRLSDLRLSGTLLNAASVKALVAYLEAPRSQTLHELHLDNTQLSGADIALLLQAMCKDQTAPRQLHLDISANNVCRHLEHLTHAISSSMTPSHLTMRAIEYREDSQFRKMLAALSVNRSTSYLNISQTALPGDASSDSCRALGKLLSSNTALTELNISGDDSRLASSMFGAGINDALAGLSSNDTLRTLHIERQRLGLQGANSLAEALRKNQALQELFCGSNEIPLQGLTDLVNALIDNTSLIYLPNMDDGREIAFRTAEATMRTMQLDVPNRVASSGSKARPLVAQSPMRRGLITSVRGSAQRTATSQAPSFPALQSYAKSGLSSPSSSSSLSSPSSPQQPLNLPRLRQAFDGAMMAAIPSAFTVQDIQTTHRLLNEQWDRQCYRLAKYLERNWCLLNNIPVPLAIEDEKFERPESAGSLAKMLETVKLDTTPRAEKDLYFDAFEQQQQQERSPASMLKSETNFQQFLLDSQPASPDEDDHDASSRQLQSP